VRLKTQILNGKRQTANGFTLLELMVAMVILTIAISIAFQAFSGTIRGWKRGTEVVEGIKHGGFAITRISSALNSTIYFYNPHKSYAFKMEKGSISGLPADTISFVTTSSAFMPKGSPFQHGPHRIKLFIDNDGQGDPSLFAIAMPAISDEEEFEDEYDTEPILVSRAIQGLEVLIYDEDTEDWSADAWEKENSIPERVMLTIYAASEDENEEPIAFSRVLEIPTAQSVKAKLPSPTIGKPRNTNDDEDATLKR